MSVQSLPLSNVDTRAAKVIGMYRDAELQLHDIMGRAVTGKRGPKNSRREAMRARNQTRRLLGALETRSRPAVAALLRQAYVRGLRLAEPNARLSTQGQSAVDSFTTSLNDRLWTASHTVGQNVKDVFRRMTLASTAHLMAGDDGNNHLVTVMQATGTTGFRDRTGRRWGLEQYAEMAIKTISRQATTEATLAVMKATGRDLVTVPTIGTTSEECKHWEGGVWSLFGDTADTKRITQLPPFHPGCEHWMEPADA